jgi:putative hydrolase of the HAD superfamily
MTPRTQAQAVASPIKTLFVDIGGVLLSDGWGHKSRALAATEFGIAAEELEERHHQAFEAFEVGKIDLERYLDLVVFHEKRPFTAARFREFMFAQSDALPGTIDLVGSLKSEFGLKIVAVSNEGRELNEYRIRTFRLGQLVDFFVSSCYVRLRKPDPAIFRLALDAAQSSAREVVYLENTPMHLEVASDLGIRGVLHTDCESTRASLASFGLGSGEVAAKVRDYFHESTMHSAA